MISSKTPITIARLKANYKCLSNLHKQGRFEHEVATTVDETDLDKFFFVPHQDLPARQEFSSVPELGNRLGKKRHPQDLQWATRNLREQVQYLIEKNKGSTDSTEDRSEEILCYFRSFGLSYEVDDYFFEVSQETSRFLIGIARDIVVDPSAYARSFSRHFPEGSERYWEVIKQIFIVGLCGVNELYRKHEYKDGLKLGQTLLKQLENFPISKTRWFGLRGLGFYLTGKIHTALGRFSAADQDFTISLEAYSESIRQKERLFAREEDKMNSLEIGFQNCNVSPDEFEQKQEDFRIKRRDHEISRAVALRRAALVTSFGHGFQSLVRGRVKDSIRVSSLARGIVNWNTGKIWSAYVDLIYFSAKRAGNSSNIEALRVARTQLKQCYLVFLHLIPAAHYKNRAIFQMALVYHYLARWHVSEGKKELEGSTPARAMRHLRMARKIWTLTYHRLQTTIDEKQLFGNKRLRAESMAIQGHILGNLALLGMYSDTERSEMTQNISKALEILTRAWDEAAPHPQIRCEVGLARAAVLKARAELLSNQARRFRRSDAPISINEIPLSAGETNDIAAALSEARETLHRVLKLDEANNNVRVQATAHLRLVELALLQADMPLKAREHLDKYKAISAHVEHDFCERWARELEGLVLELDNRFTFAIEPGNLNEDKQQIGIKLEEFYREYSVRIASIEIEKDFGRGQIRPSDSCSSYIANALLRNFGVGPKTAGAWMRKHDLIGELRQICPAASNLPDRFSNSPKS